MPSWGGLAWGYRRLRGREGLGLGDAKLLAAGGAWLGWTQLAPVVLIACACALAYVAGTAIPDARVGERTAHRLRRAAGRGDLASLPGDRLDGRDLAPREQTAAAVG